MKFFCQHLTRRRTKFSGQGVVALGGNFATLCLTACYSELILGDYLTLRRTHIIDFRLTTSFFEKKISPLDDV